MFTNGSVVTLSAAKTHGEGEDVMRLAAGTCGMVVQVNKKGDMNHEYVVEFGPYGQWYCYHNELTGQESVREEGYDRDESVFEDVARILIPSDRNVESDPNMEKPLPTIDFEADLKRRMKEIENGTAY